MVFPYVFYTFKHTIYTSIFLYSPLFRIYIHMKKRYIYLMYFFISIYGYEALVLFAKLCQSLYFLWPFHPVKCLYDALICILQFCKICVPEFGPSCHCLFTLIRCDYITWFHTSIIMSIYI